MQREEVGLAVHKGESQKMGKVILRGEEQHGQGDGNAHAIPQLLGLTSLGSRGRTPLEHTSTHSRQN